MVVFFKGIKHQHIFVCDIEYDRSKIVQFAGLLFKNIDMKNSLYQIAGSINVFLQHDNIDPHIVKYTGIDRSLLKSVGKTDQDFMTQYKTLFANVDLDNTLFASHGSKNDRKILKDSGLVSLPKHSFCTYRNAKRILNRSVDLTLFKVAEEAGYFLDNAHDAFADAWATVAALSFLLKIDGEK
jgi:exonuclease I